MHIRLLTLITTLMIKISRVAPQATTILMGRIMLKKLAFTCDPAQRMAGSLVRVNPPCVPTAATGMIGRSSPSVSIRACKI